MVEGVNGAKKQVPLNQDSTNVKKDVIIKKSIKTPIDFKYSAGNTDNTANKPTGYTDLWTGKDTVGYRPDIWTDKDSERFRAAIARGDHYDVWTDEDTARYRATLSPDERRRFDDMMAKLHPHRSYGDGKAVGRLHQIPIDVLKKLPHTPSDGDGKTIKLPYTPSDGDGKAVGQLPTGDIVNKPIDIDPDALKKIADELGYKLDKPIGIDPNALKKIADELLAARNKLKEPGDDNIGSRLIDPGFEIPVNDPEDPKFKPVKDDPLPLPADIRAKLHPNTPKLTGANKPKEPEGPLTAGEIDYARKIGADVADFLVGYTNASEQEQTVHRLRDSVTNRNVMEFLSGYEENRGMGDHFFTQLSTEYGFEDKQKYLRDTASKLSVYLKANGQPDLAKEIDVILADGGVSKKDAAKLDEIVQVMLPTMQDLKQE